MKALVVHGGENGDVVNARFCGVSKSSRGGSAIVEEGFLEGSSS
jgi:hypothetical protein